MHNSYHFIQIFPDPVESFQRSEPSLNSLDHNHQKERLPSIVVEPTELSEVESGELRWPPENLDMEDDEEDLFLEQCIPPANIADWGEEEEEEGASVILNQQPGLTLIGELLILAAPVWSLHVFLRTMTSSCYSPKTCFTVELGILNGPLLVCEAVCLFVFGMD